MVNVSFRGHRPHLPKTFTSWTVRQEGEDERNFNRWTNKDVVPAPPHDRNYNTVSFFAFWVAAGVNASSYSIGSSNLANGLSAGETIGMVAIGSVLTGMIAFICGEPGVKYHLGFPLMSRAGFGMYGSYFVVLLKCFVNFIYFGIQAYWGGLAMKVMLASIFSSFNSMENTLPASAQIQTNQLIGFVIYIVIFTPLMLWHPSKLHRFYLGCFWGVLATIWGLFIWAVSANGGGTAPPVGQDIDAATRRYRMLQAVSSVAGAWTNSAIRQSDWTRYAKTGPAAYRNQLITLPVILTVSATLGAYTTGAVANMYGKVIWQPIQLLEFLLENNYNASTRAGCFFAGLGFFLSQISVNLAQNSVAAGMDLASLAPKWVDVKRGGLIMCFVGYLIQPWRFVNAPGNFITVLNSFGMFISPLAGINAVDFWIVRRKNWKVPDLYVGDKSGIYWYTAGLNWRAFLAWSLGIFPSFPGFVVATGGATLPIYWLRMFQTAWFIGFLGGSLVYYLITLAFPPPGRPYVTELFGNEETNMVDGSRKVGRESPDDDVERLDEEAKL